MPRRRDSECSKMVPGNDQWHCHAVIAKPVLQQRQLQRAVEELCTGENTHLPVHQSPNLIPHPRHLPYPASPKPEAVMTSTPVLSPRRIVNYNRLQSDVAAMTYVVRFSKPGGPLSMQTIRTCNRMIRIANGLYRREAGMPFFRLLIEDEPFTLADLQLLVTRLFAAGMTFEARYAHYQEEALKKAAEEQARKVTLDADGFPSKHL